MGRQWSERNSGQQDKGPGWELRLRRPAGNGNHVHSRESRATPVQKSTMNDVCVGMMQLKNESNNNT